MASALMARCDSTEWMFHLPWVLLELRTMLNQGCDTSAAEAVYGQPLVVPGKFLPPAPLDLHAELQAARWAAKRFVPITWNNRYQNTYIPPGLQEFTHVFVRQDQVAHPCPHYTKVHSKSSRMATELPTGSMTRCLGTDSNQHTQL